MTGLAAALAAIGAAAIPTSAAAAAPRVTSLELTSSNLAVTSSTGHHLRVQVHAFVNASQPQDNEADITLSRPIGVGGNEGEEDHSWVFPIQYSELKTNAAGKGSLTLASAELAPFGSLSLTMTPTETVSMQDCNGSPSATTTRVKLVGTFLFSTHSGGAQKWGSVGSHSAKKPATFTGKNTLTQIFPGYSRCLPSANSNPPCTSAVLWDSGNSKVDVNGYLSGGTDVVDASRTVGYATPEGATREDDLYAVTSPPTWATPIDRLIPTANDATLVAAGLSPTSIGSASLGSLAAASRQTVTCGSAGKTESAIAWPEVQYTNGATPLTFQPQVFGAIHVPNNSDALLIALGTAAVSTSSPSPSISSAEHFLRSTYTISSQGFSR